jgi:hypothetical protein
MRWTWLARCTAKCVLVNTTMNLPLLTMHGICWPAEELLTFEKTLQDKARLVNIYLIFYQKARLNIEGTKQIIAVLPVCCQISYLILRWLSCGLQRHVDWWQYTNTWDVPTSPLWRRKNPEDRHRSENLSSYLSYSVERCVCVTFHENGLL